MYKLPADCNEADDGPHVLAHHYLNNASGSTTLVQFGFIPQPHHARGDRHAAAPEKDATEDMRWHTPCIPAHVLDRKLHVVGKMDLRTTVTAIQSCGGWRLTRVTSQIDMYIHIS